MAMYDWNGNGKKDSMDDFIEYQIYQQSTNHKGTSSGSSSGSGVTLLLTILTLAFPPFGILVLLYVLFSS